MPSKQYHSLVFCEDCGTLLDPPVGSEDYVGCDCCGNTVDAKAFENIQVITQSRPGTFVERPKAAALEKQSDSKSQHLHDGATIKEKCPKCDAPEMVFHTAQLRSADEGQTIFYKCVQCGYKYSVNS